jgi:hypothetical protein
MKDQTQVIHLEIEATEDHLQYIDTLRNMLRVTSRGVIVRRMYNVLIRLSRSTKPEDTLYIVEKEGGNASTIALENLAAMPIKRNIGTTLTVATLPSDIEEMKNYFERWNVTTPEQFVLKAIHLLSSLLPANTLGEIEIVIVDTSKKVLWRIPDATLFI